MKFSFDPELIAKARQLILHKPKLNVLKPENEGRYTRLVVAIELVVYSSVEDNESRWAK
jgi:hypothetical protein